MDATIEPRHRNDEGERQHEINTPTIIEKQNGRGGKPVGRMRRRHRAGTATTDDEMNIAQLIKWTWAVYSAFDSVPNERIPDGKEHKQNDQADSPAQPALPDCKSCRQNQKWREKNIPGAKLHRFIEKRVLRCQIIDAAEYADVNLVK